MVLLVLDEDGLAGVRANDLFHELGRHSVESACHLSKYDRKSAHMAEHIVGVAEHNIVCRRLAECHVPGVGDAAVIGVDEPNVKGVRAPPHLFRQPRCFAAIIDDDDAEVGEVNALLKF